MVVICTSLLLSIVFLIAYATAGYGTNSLFYSVPWENPVGYIKRLSVLATSGVLGLLGLSSVDVVVYLPELLIPAVIMAVLVLPPLAWVIWRQVRHHPWAMFFVGWLVLMLLPQAGVMPSDRLLFAPAVGSSALLAIFLSRVLFCEGLDKPRRALRVLGIGILISACGFSAVAKVAQGVTVGKMASSIREIVVTAEVGSPELGRREVFILQSPSMLAAFSGRSTWVIETQDLQVRFWPMQFGNRGVFWTRIDDNSFELQSADEPFLGNMFEIVFLTESSIPAPGTKFETALFTVEIVEVNDRGVTTFRVRCRESLETPRYRFLVSRQGKLVAVSPPTVGESIQLETAVSGHVYLR